MGGYIGTKGYSTVVTTDTDNRYVNSTGDTITGNVTVDGNLTVDTNTLYVDSTNNRVGIGTSSSLSKLEVNGGAANTYLRIVDTRATYPTYIGAEQGSTVFGRWGLGESMRINSSGNVSIGTTASTANITLPINGKINTDGGTLYSQSIANSTTGAGANMYIDAAGFMQRSVSSIKYKTDVEDLYEEKSEVIYQMRPVWYRSKGELDRQDWSYYGFIAEEVAEIEPRLVHFKQNDDGTTEPEGFMYERLTVFLVAEMQKLKAELDTAKAERVALQEALAKIDELEARVATLEGGAA